VIVPARRALAILAGFWLALLPLFALWLWLDRGIAPWDPSMHAGLVLRLHDGLLKLNPWRAYELSRFYPPLFHVLAVPAAFVSTHPDAYSFGNWLALLALLWLTFLLGRTLAGTAAGLAAALLLPGFAYVSWMGRMAMTDLTLAATVTFTLWLLVRPVDLGEPRQARLLGLSIALGLLAKWPYLLFTALPLAHLLWDHHRSASRLGQTRAFRRSVVHLVLWPIVLAAPWYVRSVPSLLGKAWWHLGSGVATDEGDPPVWSVASLAYYARQLWFDYVRIPLLLLFAVGVVVLLLAWLQRRRRPELTIAPAARWIPLGLSVAGGLVSLVLIANKDPRYLLPFMPVAAVVCGAWLAALRPDAQRRALVACGVLGWLLAADDLFRLAPPDPTDWKLDETADLVQPHLDAAASPLRVLVVPNDEHMNFTSLGYALLRRTRAKAEVERVGHVLDEATLATYTLAVLVVPPPDETPLSQGTRAAAELLLSRRDWRVESRVERGDGREIVLLVRDAPGA
jgi:4-amino-4-deoxy-L-arabinose transferase-like glycosyltransferase